MDDKIINLTNDASGRFKEVIESKPEKNIKGNSSKASVLQKAENYITEKYDIRSNVVKSRIEISEKGKNNYDPLDDRFFNSLFVDLQKNQKIPISFQHLGALLDSDTIAENYDPLKSYIFGLPKQPAEVKYLKQLFQSIQLKSESESGSLLELFIKWFVGRIPAMILDKVDQRTVNHLVIVLVGGQGLGKTTFLNSLMPEELSEYTYNGFFDVRSKDHIMMLSKMALINLDEMETMTRYEEGSLKSLITSEGTEIRKPYGRQSTYFKRRASFCGSLNRKEVLTDQTGNRRYIMVDVHDIDLTNKVPIDKCFAEAFALYKAGYPYWLSKEEILKINISNSEYRLQSIEEQFVERYLVAPTDLEITTETWGVKFLQASDIAAKLAENMGGKINVNNSVIRNIGVALAERGFKKVSRYIPEKQTSLKLWAVKFVDGNSVAVSSKEGGESEFPI